MAYLAIAPVYWLPYLVPEVLRPIKIIIFCLALFFLWGRHDKLAMRFTLHSFYGVQMLFLLLATSIPGFLMAAPGQFGRTLLDFALVFVMLWSAYAVAKNVDQTATILTSSAIALAFCSIPIATNALAGFPSWVPPAEYKLTTLAEAGFGAARTGWSNGLALYVPLLMLPILQTGRAALMRLTLLGLLLIILACQYWSGGRAGLFASAVAILLMLLITPVWGRRRWGATFGIIAVLSLFAILAATDALMTEESLAHLRLDRLESPQSGFLSALDQFSAGRLSLLQYAFNQFLDKPFGSGFGNAFFDYSVSGSSYFEAEVHNLWLKLLVETGPLPVVMLLFLVSRLLLEIGRSLSRLSLLSLQDGSHRLAYARQVTYMTVIIQGLIISMFEPNALIGSFQATAIWWFVAGAALRNAALAQANFSMVFVRSPARYFS